MQIYAVVFHQNCSTPQAIPAYWAKPDQIFITGEKKINTDSYRSYIS